MERKLLTNRMQRLLTWPRSTYAVSLVGEADLIDIRMTEISSDFDCREYAKTLRRRRLRCSGTEPEFFIPALRRLTLPRTNSLELPNDLISN